MAAISTARPRPASIWKARWSSRPPRKGAKPRFAGKSRGEGETATFDVVFVTPEGRMQARPGLRYELLKVESRYQWYRHDNRWDYEPIKSTKRISDGSVDVATDKP